MNVIFEPETEIKELNVKIQLLKKECNDQALKVEKNRKDSMFPLWKQEQIALDNLVMRLEVATKRRDSLISTTQLKLF